MTNKDWRKPEYREEAFLRFYGLHLKYRAHPGLVYSWLPAIADELDMTPDQKRWLVWLNGNTQNPVTTWLLLRVAPEPGDWRKAVEFWEENYRLLDWDIDRRYHKSKFGEATADWAARGGATAPWPTGVGAWSDAWEYAVSWKYMGRLSGWSMLEYAKILFPEVPDSSSMLLEDNGSRSHRNGLAVVSGSPIEAAYWDKPDYTDSDLVDFELLAADLLDRVDPHPDATRLTLESALCTYKSWHKPRRRYAGVYADMGYERLNRVAERWPDVDLSLFWAARQRDLPWYWRLEDTVGDAGLAAAKQNHYLETGQPVMMSWDYPDMTNPYDQQVRPRE